jgi:SAM-dependent methyltransferase
MFHKDLEKRRLELIEEIKEKSSFSKEETERIIKFFFHKVPRSVQILSKRYDLANKKVLEIASAYGQTLLYWGSGSEAVEIEPEYIKFLNNLDRKTYSLNVEDGFDGIPAENYDVIFSSNLFEHLVAPHFFIARLYSLLKPGGLLIVAHPVVPTVFVRKLWTWIGYQGWSAVEHVNFFTPETARLTLEVGGFKVLEQFFPGFSTESRFLRWVSTSRWPSSAFQCVAR